MRELARSDTKMIFCSLSLRAQEAFGEVVPEANTSIFNSLDKGNQVNAVDASEDVVSGATPLTSNSQGPLTQGTGVTGNFSSKILKRQYTVS